MLSNALTLRLFPFALTSLLLGCQVPEARVSSPPPSTSPTTDALDTTDTTPTSNSAMSPIPFSTLAQGNALTTGLEEPTLLVMGDAASVDQISSMVDNPAVVDQIKTVDFTKAYIVAVFAGPVESGGYSIDVQTISQQGAGVNLQVQVVPPPADRMVPTVISYPYHIVTVDRQSLTLVPGAAWSMFSADGKFMADTQLVD